MNSTAQNENDSGNLGHSSAIPVGQPSLRLPSSQLATSRRPIPAWALSFSLHLLICIALFLLITQTPSGGSDIENRSGGIVLVNSTDQATEYLDQGDIEEASEATVAADSPPPLAMENDAPPELPGLESSEAPIVGAGESLLEGVTGADSLIEVPTQTGKIGGNVTTEVFGIKGTGSRFVYVFDRSKSMEGYNARPMIAARQQLLQSLDSLTTKNKFQIIFYNDKIRIFNPDGQPTMYQATEELKTKAKNFVASTPPDGGTDHISALLAAFKLGADVIFFLTDAEGGFTDSEIRLLSRYNRNAAVINAIEFGERQGRDRSLKRMAESTGGTYLFKNIRTLEIGNE